MSMTIRNYYVDVGGKHYRVALSSSGRALVVARRSPIRRQDVGAALAIDGKIGRLCVQAAREQMEADKAC